MLSRVQLMEPGDNGRTILGVQKLAKVVVVSEEENATIQCRSMEAETAQQSRGSLASKGMSATRSCVQVCKGKRVCYAHKE